MLRRSEYSQPRTHAGLGMFKHVAMNQPIPRIVRDEGNLSRLLWPEEDRVAERTRRAVLRQLPEVMSMKVHPVRPLRLVYERNPERLSPRGFDEGSIGHIGDAVERPRVA